jgi:glycosyltransferase involved in cell wall biosynthesis
VPITIGIPFYNAESYLTDAIRSIFAQTYQDWELILVDDGSTDRSLDIARAVKDPRVRVISDGENHRLSYRLNQIVSSARFDLVGRMDADDLISPTRFEKQKKFLDAHPEYDLVTTGICSITNDKKPYGVRSASPDVQITGRGLLLGQCAPAHAPILGRTSWFRRNPYNTSINRIEDYELWLRAYSKNDFRVYFMTEHLYYYREEINVTPERALTAYAGQRKLYLKYGFLGFKKYELPMVLMKSYGKSFIVRVLSACNKMDILLNRRNSVIDDQKSMEYFMHEIDYIMATKIPGLD